MLAARALEVEREIFGPVVGLSGVPRRRPKFRGAWPGREFDVDIAADICICIDA